jgi:hypothetical protein
MRKRVWVGSRGRRWRVEIGGSHQGGGGGGRWWAVGAPAEGGDWGAPPGWRWRMNRVESGVPPGWRWRRNRVDTGGAAGVEVEWRRKLRALWFACVE